MDSQAGTVAKNSDDSRTVFRETRTKHPVIIF